MRWPDTRYILVPSHGASFERIQDEIGCHQLGERGWLALDVGVMFDERRARFAIDDDPRDGVHVG
jgi:hypothetical protein